MPAARAIERDPAAKSRAGRGRAVDRHRHARRVLGRAPARKVTRDRANAPRAASCIPPRFSR